MALLWLLTERVHLYYVVSSVAATEAATISNFALNHLWTFRRSRRAGSLAAAFLRYNLVALGYIALTAATLFLLTHVFGLLYLLANLLAIGACAAWNYVMCRRWVWTAHSPGSRRFAQEGADD
jgi:putative flippase GtrA